MPARNISYNSLNWGQGHHGSSNLIENYQFANFHRRVMVHSHRADFQFRRFCSDCHLWKHLSKTRHTQKTWHWTDCYHQKTHFQLWIWIQGYFYQLEDSNPQSKWSRYPPGKFPLIPWASWFYNHFTKGNFLGDIKIHQVTSRWYIYIYKLLIPAVGLDIEFYKGDLCFHDLKFEHQEQEWNSSFECFGISNNITLYYSNIISFHNPQQVEALISMFHINTILYQTS